MEKEQRKGFWGFLLMVILAGITVIGCILMPDTILNGESVLGLKFLGTLILIEGVFTTLTLREDGLLPTISQEEEDLLLGMLDKLFSVLYFVAILIIWSDLAGCETIYSIWKIILGGIWVTVYPFISVVETTVDLLTYNEEDI